MQQRDATKKRRLFLLFYFDQKFQQFTIQSKIILKVYLDLQFFFSMKWFQNSMLIINILWKTVDLKHKNSDSTSKKVYPHLLFLAHFILNSIIMQQRDALFWELRRKFTLALIIMTSLSSPKNSHNVARILLKLKLHFNIYFSTIPRGIFKLIILLYFEFRLKNHKMFFKLVEV